MVRSLYALAFGFLAFASAGTAATIVINVNPLTGSPAPGQPGRQIVGGEPSLTFDLATDQLVIDTQVFGVTDPLSFANALSTSLPTSGANFIVLQNGAPLAAGTAADAIATQITSPTPGFFIYFNSGQNLARLVFSTDLDDPTSDLAILARFTNLSTAQGFSGAGLSAVSSTNVASTPEPSSVLLTAAGVLLGAVYARRRRARA